MKVCTCYVFSVVSMVTLLKVMKSKCGTKGVSNGSNCIENMDGDQGNLKGPYMVV